MQQVIQQAKKTVESALNIGSWEGTDQTTNGKGAEEIVELRKEIIAFKEINKKLTEENAILSEENSKLKEENCKLKEENETLKGAEQKPKVSFTNIQIRCTMIVDHK